MMFVSGETAEASIETTYLIEEIVREQVIEMVGSLSTCPECSTEGSSLRRLPRWPTGEGPSQSRSSISYFRSDTTQQKSRGLKHSCLGKMYGRMSRIRTTRVEETPKPSILKM